MTALLYGLAFVGFIIIFELTVVRHFNRKDR